MTNGFLESKAGIGRQLKKYKLKLKQAAGDMQATLESSKTRLAVIN